MITSRAWYDPVKDCFHIILYKRERGIENIATGIFEGSIEWSDPSLLDGPLTSPFLSVDVEEAKAIAIALDEEIERVEAGQRLHPGSREEVRRLVLPSPGEYEGSSLRGGDVVGGVQRDGDAESFA